MGKQQGYDLERIHIQVSPDPPYNGDKKFPSSVFSVARVVTSLSGSCPKMARVPYYNYRNTCTLRVIWHYVCGYVASSPLPK